MAGGGVRDRKRAYTPCPLRPIFGRICGCRTSATRRALRRSYGLQNLCDKVRLAEAREERRKAAEPIRQQMGPAQSGEGPAANRGAAQKQAREEDAPLIAAARAFRRGGLGFKRREKRMGAAQPGAFVITRVAITPPSPNDPAGKVVLKIRGSVHERGILPVVRFSGVSRTSGIANHHRARFKMSGHKRWALRTGTDSCPTERALCVPMLRVCVVCV